MRVVANSAVLRDGRMLIRERALFIRMALIAHHVYGRFLEIVLGLTMGIMTVRAHHLSFLDWMVRRHRIPCIDLLMALVTNFWFTDRHRQSLLALDMGMLDQNSALHVEVGVRIVAIRARYPVPGMS